MPNKIRVRRGTDAQRTAATNIDNYEIHYSTGNAGDGRPERLWIADSAATAGNSGDLLVGPFSFHSGSNQITVSTDYQTGRVTIGYQDAATFAPSRSVTRVASTYSNNSTIEVGDAFTGSHTFTVTVGSGSNEIGIDRAGFTYLSNTTNFASPLNAIDGLLLNSGSQSLSWAQSLSAPANFSIANIANRRRVVTIFTDPPAGSGFSQTSSTANFDFGWRVRGFVSTTLYNAQSLPTVAQVTSTSGANISRFNEIQQTPTSATVRNYLLPNDGQQWHCYLVHSCDPVEGSPVADGYGWTPSATVVGSGAIALTEVTDLANQDLLICGAGQSNLGGQTTSQKIYRIWRFGGQTGFFGDGSTLSFSIT